jgi:hypothetical protein
LTAYFALINFETFPRGPLTFHFTAFPKNIRLGGRLSTVDLLVLTILDQILFKLKILFAFFCKTSYLKEKVSSTEPSPSVSFPLWKLLALINEQAHMTSFKLRP